MTPSYTLTFRPGAHFIEEHREEIGALAQRLHSYLEKSNPSSRGDGLAQFAAAWNAAVADKSIEEPRRREILTKAYRWLHGRSRDRESYRTLLGTFLDHCLESEAVLRQAPVARAQSIQSLELAFSGFTASVERIAPDTVIRAGKGSVALLWVKNEAQVCWGGTSASSIDLRATAVRAFSSHARLPGAEALRFANLLVEEIAYRHQLAPPNFQYPPGLRAGQQPGFLFWTAAGVDRSKEEELPAWLKGNRQLPVETPAPAEIDLFRVDPELGYRLDRLLCAAALEDRKSQPERGAPGQEKERTETEESPGVVGLIVEALAQRVGRPVEDVANLCDGVFRRRQRDARNSEECAANTAALAALWNLINRR